MISTRLDMGFEEFTLGKFITARSAAILVALAALCPASRVFADAPTAGATTSTVAAPPAEPASQGMLLPGFEWALPCESRLNSSGQRLSSATVLSGSVTAWNVDADFGQLVEIMLEGALGANPEAKNIDKAIAHYGQARAEKVANLKDAADYLVPYRGFGPSTEAADVILNEKLNLKDKGSAEYAKQRLVDEVHPQIIAKAMQLALALGTKDPVQHDLLVQNALASLQKIGGKDRAQATLNKMEEWRKLPVPETFYKGTADWQIEEFQTKVKEVTKLAMDGDPVMSAIVKRLHKYNHHTKASAVSSKVIEGGFAIASFACPGYIVPAAINLMQISYIMGTGGTEERKLIKELYLDKRVESRYRTINEEAQLALSQYQNAANIHNPVLMACCESIITQLVGAENINDILGPRTLLAHQGMAGGEKTMTASSPSPSLQ